jgi:DNA-binding response OmpR family regulator
MPDNSGPGKHILAINDDAAILQLFDDLLTEVGYQVSLDSFIRPTTDLLDVLRTMQPDLVIMDFVIGGELKGWQLLQAARMHRATKNIPIVICTGAVTQVNEMGANLEAHGVKVVIKPFDIDELLSVIDKVWLSLESDISGSKPPVLKVVEQ